MSPEARALLNVIPNHHREVVRQSREPLKDIDSALISYGILCDKAGLSYLFRNVGPFLREIAERCQVFHKSPDYEAFLSLLKDAKTRHPVKIFSFCLMPNHFHF